MKIIPVLIYFIAAVVFYYYLQISGVKPSSFFNPEIIIFLIASVFLTMANFSLKAITGSLKNAFSLNKPPEVYEESRQVINTAWKYLLRLTFLFMLISFFYGLGTSETSKTGPFIGVFIITPLYAMVLKFFIFMPLEVSLEKKLLISKKFHIQK